LLFHLDQSRRRLSKVDPKLYKKSENGNAFVHATVKKGILPTILEELLAARKRAKKDMKLAPTEFERAVQNGRQLALKVSANSVYGFTGATVGQLPCVPIASSVTSYGRQLLEKTKEFVETEFTIAKGYQHNAQVVYGDTDSVMIKFGPDNVKDTFPLAIKAAEECPNTSPKPIDLEFEKVYFPYLLNEQETLCWSHVDSSGQVRQDGYERTGDLYVETTVPWFEKLFKPRWIKSLSVRMFSRCHRVRQIPDCRFAAEQDGYFSVGHYKVVE
jgi:DNA polymerase delta subunit 1